MVIDGYLSLQTLGLSIQGPFSDHAMVYEPIITFKVWYMSRIQTNYIAHEVKMISKNSFT